MTGRMSGDIQQTATAIEDDSKVLARKTGTMKFPFITDSLGLSLKYFICEDRNNTKETCAQNYFLSQACNGL